MFLSYLILTSLAVYADHLTAEMNINMDKIVSMVPSPDASKVAYITRHYYSDNSTREKILYVKKITSDPQDSDILFNITGVSECIWDPASKYLAYLDTSDTSILYVIDATTGAAVTQNTFDLPISMIRWSSSGTFITFVAQVYPGMSLKESAEYSNTRTDQYHSNAVAFDSTPLYRYDAWTNGTVNHVFYVRTSSTASGYSFATTPVDIMKNYAGSCPIYRDGDITDYNIAPNGKFIAFVAQPSAVATWTDRLHVYLHPIPDSDDDEDQNSNIIMSLGSNTKHTNPIFSPDSRKLAFLTGKRANEYGVQQKITIVDVVTRQSTTLLDDWDYDAVSMEWPTDLPDYILLRAYYHARIRVFPVKVSTGEVDSSNTLYTIHSAYALNATRMIYTKSSFSHPRDIYIADIFSSSSSSTFNELQLTDLNKAVLDSLEAAPYEPVELNLTGENNDPLPVFYFAPRSVATSTYAQTPTKSSIPLLVWVHGGPEYISLNEWDDERFNAASMLLDTDHMETALLITNIHGSVSYGDAYSSAIQHNWHTTGLNDVLAARKQILQKYDYLNENRTACAGISFGGYMMNLLQCQATLEKNPFVVLITHDGIFDTTKEYLESDIMYFVHAEMGDYPWVNRTLSDEMSPSHQPGVGRFHTPHLLFHGLKDWRCTRGQGIGLFNALQRVRDDDHPCYSRLIIFPDENHHVLQPDNQIAWYTQVHAWIDEYLTEDAAAVTMAAKVRLSEEYEANQAARSTKTHTLSEL